MHASQSRTHSYLPSSPCNRMESFFQQHIGTNYVPTVAERRQIEDVITHSYQKIKRFEAEIDELQEKLELLKDLRSEMDRFCEQHLALLSPARNLPQDILQAIFIACLPEDRNPCMSNKDAPMLLTQICSSWRKTALSTPRLWAAIHIVLPNIHVDMRSPFDALEIQKALIEHTLSMRGTAVKEWLNKSGACPLSISIYQCTGWGPNSQLAAHAIRNSHISFIKNAIVPYLRRCCELDIYVSRDTLERFHEIGLTRPSDATRKVHITTCPSTSFQFTVERLVNQWKNAISLIPPHPNSITLDDLRILQIDVRSTTLLPCWQQLAELSLLMSQDILTDVDLFDFSARILIQCNALRMLKLGLTNVFSVLRHSTTPSTGDIILPHLETLRIALPGNVNAVDFSQRLYIPEIRKLDLELSGTDFELGEEIFTSLLRSSRNLSSLGFYWPHQWLSSSANIVKLLQVIPSLTSLYFVAGSLTTNRWMPSISSLEPQLSDIINDDLLFALAPQEGDNSNIICPQLEELECHHNLVTGFTEHALKEFVKARRNDHRVTTLRRISVSVNRVKETRNLQEEKVSLGKDSTVYFRAPERREFLSPWQGIVKRSFIEEEHLAFEVYTEL